MILRVYSDPEPLEFPVGTLDRLASCGGRAWGGRSLSGGFALGSGGESLEESLNSFTRGAAGGSDLHEFELDATATGLGPPIERGDVSLPALAASGQFV